MRAARNYGRPGALDFGSGGVVEALEKLTGELAALGGRELEGFFEDLAGAGCAPSA